jgi:hypothetical protein
LFDQARTLHGLGDAQRLLLEVAALLHDIGHFINTVDHDKHGYYILQANRLIGLDYGQQELVANLVRYHRRSMPGAEDANFKSLAPKDRTVSNYRRCCGWPTAWTSAPAMSTASLVKEVLATRQRRATMIENGRWISAAGSSKGYGVPRRSGGERERRCGGSLFWRRG